MRSRGAMTGLLLVLAMGAGCAHVPVAEPPLPAELRKQLGRIGIAGPGTPSFSVGAQPVRGAARGAGVGAMTALSGTFSAAMQGGDPRAGAGLILLSPGIVVIGAVIGAIVAPSEAEVVAAEQALSEAMADPRLPGDLQQRLLAKVRDRSDQPVVPVRDLSGTELEQDANPDVAAEVDTIILLDAPLVALKKTTCAGQLDPALQLTVQVTTTLLQVHSREKFYTVSSEYLGEPMTFTAWGANGARPFREALDAAAEHVAQHIVAQLFGLAAPDGSSSQGDGAAGGGQGAFTASSPPLPGERSWSGAERRENGTDE